MIRWPDLWFGPVNLNTYGRYIKTTNRPPAAEHSSGGIQIQARTDGESNHCDTELYAGKAEDNLQPIRRSMDEQNSMDGTIRINGELKPMMPYGCHSDRAPDKFNSDVVEHSVMWSWAMHALVWCLQHIGIKPKEYSWPMVMSRNCRYDRATMDNRCDKCRHPYDIEYVEGLK